jgi:hypothetical protein
MLEKSMRFELIIPSFKSEIKRQMKVRRLFQFTSKARLMQARFVSETVDCKEAGPYLKYLSSIPFSALPCPASSRAIS